MLIGLASSVQGQNPPDELDLDLLVTAWEYALEDVPNEYLEACFRRAVKAKAEDAERYHYPISAVDIRKEYPGLRDEHLQQERLTREARLSEAATKGICQRCMGAGWLVDRYNPLEPWARKCPDCEGPAAETPKAPAPSMWLDEWAPRHKARYPEGCDLKHCVICYGWPGGRPGDMPPGFEWLKGAIPPPAEEDAHIRQSLAQPIEQEVEVEEEL